MAIPEKIKKLAHQVRTAIYGKEVRESIAESMELTANVADEAKVTANEAKEVTQQLIDGSFDTGELNTNIEERLNNLEKEYAPRLSEAEKGISDNRKYIDEQLELKQQEIENVVNKIERVKFKDIQEPFYICHRGGANIFPENTMEAYEGCLALGINVIEQDVQQLSDGTLAVIHDYTVDRTTDKTGSVKDYSTMGFKNLTVDVLQGWKVKAPLFEEVLDRFGKNAIYTPESKDQKSTQKIVDALIKYDLTEYALITSFNITDLAPAVHAGIPTLLATDTRPPEEIVNSGVKYVGVSTNATDTYIEDCISAGLKVVVWTVNHRYQRDRYISLGVSGFYSDDPFYLSGLVPPLKKDPYMNQMFYHGMIKSLTERGKFSDGNRWGFLETSNSNALMEGRDFVLQGWAGELPDTFVLEFDFKTVNHISGGWLGVQFCTRNDIYNDFGDVSYGYNLILGRNGNFDLYRSDSGVGTRIGTLTSSPINDNTIVPVKIEVTATQIIITRKDTGNSMSFTDSTYREGYLHFGRKWSAGNFGNVMVN